MSFQQVIIQGRVGKDPDIRSTGSGDTVANFSVAVDGWSKKGEEKKTEWFNVVCFKQKADVVRQYVNKGDLILVSGSFQTEKWQDKEGNERTSMKLYANQLSLIGRTQPREEQPERNDKPDRASKPAQDQQDFDDEIPF